MKFPRPLQQRPEREPDAASTLGESGRGTHPRRQRFDARDNRQRILDAAHAEFEAAGVKAPVAHVVDRAQVGRTTFFRHFPDRETLLVALHEGFVRSLEEEAQRLGAQDDAVFSVLAFYVDAVARRPAQVDYWLAHPRVIAVNRALERLQAVLEPLLDRAVQAGLCRRDVHVMDIGVVLHALTLRDPGTSREQREIVGRRVLTLLRFGLQAMPDESYSTV